jgi:hypothetical protein
MDTTDRQRLRKWFDHYARSFFTGNDQADGPIRLKYAHTLRVCDNARMLGASVSLPDSEVLLVDAAALFHDVGRFRQYRDWGTFVDLLSVNHARLGLQVLGRHRVLDLLDVEEKRIVAGAVCWHNALSVPSRVGGKRRRIALLLRDADKLDIWKVVTDYYRRRLQGQERDAAVELSLPDEDACSTGALSSLAEGRMVRLPDIRTLNDFKLLQIGWVYDLNFPAAFRVLDRSGFLASIAETLPQTDDVQGAVGTAMAYLKRRAAE